MSEEVAAHISLKASTHDMTDRRHIIVGGGVYHAENEIKNSAAKYQLKRERHRRCGCRTRYLADQHRQHELAKRSQRRTEKIEQKYPFVLLVIRKKAFEQGHLARFFLSRHFSLQKHIKFNINIIIYPRLKVKGYLQKTTPHQLL